MDFSQQHPNQSAIDQFLNDRVQEKADELDDVDLSAAETVNPAEKILQAEEGRGLIRFCKELSNIIIRRFMVEKDMDQLRKKLVISLIDTLECTDQQAQCVIDLSLELIHAKVHGNYRRSNVELSYLIAVATGAVRSVETN